LATGKAYLDGYMQIIFVSFFLLLSDPHLAIVKAVPVETMQECLAAKAVIDEQFADPRYRAKHAVTTYKGNHVVYMASECIPLLPKDEF
tara:strand:- start:3444 stop:3710 length:267 start_codon:yes stop_codon:yes gene_type:complete